MTIITTSRKVAALATAAALATSLAACGSGDAGTSTAGTSASGDGAVSGTVSLLTPIFEGSSGKELLEGTLLPEIYAKYSDVKVTVDYTSYAKLNTKLNRGGLRAGPRRNAHGCRLGRGVRRERRHGRPRQPRPHR